MNINFCWFSYEKDGSILPYSVGSVLSNFPSSKCFIYEDGLKPIEPEHKEKLLSDNRVEIRPTWFLRKRNLNGIECVRGILGGMQDASEDCDWVAKIDADTMIHSPNYINESLTRGIKEKKLQVGFGKDMSNFCWGWIYFLKKEIILSLLHEMVRTGRMFYDPSGKFAEDSTLTGIIRHLGGAESVEVDRFKLYHDNIFSWDYSSPPSMNRISEETSIVNFGYANARVVPDFYEKRESLMKKFYEQC